MKIGTRSLLFGAHQFVLHPIILFIAWWRLYGFPWDIRLWFAFVVHDWGYISKPNMDGPEGESHPILGSKIMARLFGDEWGEFTLLHSRWFANKLGKRFSKLCVADKYAICITPSWLYIPMVWATGELKEYMTIRKDPLASGTHGHKNAFAWWRSVQEYMKEWVMKHKDSPGVDTWMSPNGFEVDKPSPKLPGYLEGGYEPDRYIVLKSNGDLIDPSAKYMVLRFDGRKDPHAIKSIVAYAISVAPENMELARGMLEALAKELDMDVVSLWAEYSSLISCICNEHELLMNLSEIFKHGSY